MNSAQPKQEDDIMKKINTKQVERLALLLTEFPKKWLLVGTETMKLLNRLLAYSELKREEFKIVRNAEGRPRILMYESAQNSDKLNLPSLKPTGTENDNISCQFICVPDNRELVTRVYDRLIRGERETALARRRKKLSVPVYVLVFFPRRSAYWDGLLEEWLVRDELTEGIMVTARDTNADFYKVDVDVLSMERPSVYRNLFLKYDTSDLIGLARIFNDMQPMASKSLRVHLFGSWAKRVLDLANTMSGKALHTPMPHTKNTAAISDIFIISRDVDYVTAFATDLSYESIMRRQYRLEKGNNKIVLSKDQEVELDNPDPFFSRYRSWFFCAVAQELKSYLYRLRNKKDEVNTGLDTLRMRKFIKDDLGDVIGQKKAAEKHTTIIEEIFDHTVEYKLERKIEVAILSGADIKDVSRRLEYLLSRSERGLDALRLLVLLSLTRGGLPPETYASLRAAYLLSYGYSHTSTWHNLRRLGLLVPRATSAASTSTPGTSNYVQLQRALCPEVANLAESRGIDADEMFRRGWLHYLYTGEHCPVTAALVQAVLAAPSATAVPSAGRAGPGGVPGVPAEAARVLRGMNVPVDVRDSRSARLMSAAPEVVAAGAANSGELPAGTAVVVFVGGVARGELAALRFIAQREQTNILVVTTDVFTGVELVEQAWEAYNV